MSRQLRTRNSREPTTCSKVSPCRQKPAPLIPTISLDQHRILAFSARNFSLEDTGDTRYHVGVVFLADTEEDNRRLAGFASEIYRPLVHDRPIEGVDPPG